MGKLKTAWRRMRELGELSEERWQTTLALYRLAKRMEADDFVTSSVNLHRSASLSRRSEAVTEGFKQRAAKAVADGETPDYPQTAWEASYWPNVMTEDRCRTQRGATLAEALGKMLAEGSFRE